jgi:hypothetical protein
MTACTSGREENFHARYRKRPAFSPTQPWRAARLSSPKSETRLVRGKATASEETEAYVWYGELLSQTKRQLADFFGVPLEKPFTN